MRREMLCHISQVGVRYDSDPLYALVMISNEAKLIDHCPKTSPSRERPGFDDETGKTAGCLDVRVDRLRQFHKVVLLERRFWLHEQDGMLGIEVVFDHLSLLTIVAVHGTNSPTVLMRTFRLQTVSIQQPVP